MIESIQYKNFKVLRDTTLPVGAFTLLVGANGSGKSTAIKALRLAVTGQSPRKEVASVGVSEQAKVELKVSLGGAYAGYIYKAVWGNVQSTEVSAVAKRVPQDSQMVARLVSPFLQQAAQAIYTFDANEIASAVQLQPEMRMQPTGRGLVNVLDRLRDRDPERFEALNEELSRWLPEFDRILFDTPVTGARAFLLRTRVGHYSIPATELSQGTLIALAILTLAYIPDAGPFACIEEPDRGIHPRLLRNVRDALYRLAYPKDYGENRAPVQVVVTTHSPYLLDLFKDRPEEIVLAHKSGSTARFERLMDRRDISEMLENAHLGDVWYSGILGGIPSGE